MIHRPLLLVLLLALRVPAADWLHWRGASRDGTTTETSGWDEGLWSLPAGPKRLWEADCGQGGSSPLVAGGKVFTLGWNADQDTVRCLNLADGKEQWRQTYPAPRYGRHSEGDKGFYGGPSATPEYDASTGLLYTLGCDGALRAWDTRKGGALAWKRNVIEDYQVERRPPVTKHSDTQRDYGLTCAPLASENALLVEVGSANRGTVIAFDKAAGKELWASELRDPAGHSGGMLPLPVEGKSALAVFTARHVALLSLEKESAGKTLALRPWATRYANNLATLAAVDGDVIASTKWTDLTARLRPTLSKGWQTVWEAKNHGSNVTSPVLLGGRLYVASRGMTCLDAASGAEKWTDGRFSDATSIIACADGRLITWSNNGDLGLVDADKNSPGKFRELAWIPLVREGMAWPHVVLADRHLLCRVQSGALICLRLEK